METTADGLGEILKNLTILPPRIEDAGLEDCALPPDSIMEAFSRAAASLKSRIIPSDPTSPACVHDPGPSNGALPDILTGAEIPSPPLCGGENFGEVLTGAEGADDVVVVGVGGDGEGADRVVVVGGDGDGEEKGKACVVDGDEERDCEEGGGGGDGGEEKPRLVEGLI